ncbi:hypothetical protein ACFLQ2_01390 [archaeon]
MEEVAYGDSERVKEVKAWLKKGMKIAEVREKLEKFGYSSYHVAFLLEEATGKSFVPAKPIVLIDTTKVKAVVIIAVVAVIAFVLVTWVL